MDLEIHAFAARFGNPAGANPCQVGNTGKFMDLAFIVEAIRSNQIRITDHADEEAQADYLSFDEILVSVFQGEIIEDYPDDKPYPSCLIYGETFKEEPIHTRHYID